MSSPSDEAQPFALAGKVRAWDPLHRWLWIGEMRLSLAPNVSCEDLSPGQSVVISGYKQRDAADGPSVTWMVTEVRRARD